MRSKIILFLALVMGGLTTFLFFNYMQQFDSAKVVNANTEKVVVASEKIEENQRITEGMLKVVQMPSQGLHPQAARTVEELTGKYATAAIETDEIILTHRVKSEKEEELFVSRKVKDGYRGVSVGVNFVQSVSNLIEPEDIVDVVASETLKDEKGQQIKTEQILSKVTVLAVGRKMLETKTEEEEYVEYSSVTLELRPEDAVKLINAAEKGPIHFTVHTRIKEESSEKESKE
ncbi:Flp pilus assembly protein CpaB [Bacillus sp. SCS-153A]|uniref:Flp pilus assembly protein CpaB n=1 Tax=Rossellomorea sedimentorum TaxID=3115294 RepID=UPI003905C496